MEPVALSSSAAQTMQQKTRWPRSSGARALLAQAIEAKVAASLNAHVDKLDDAGRRRCEQRQGQGPEAELEPAAPAGRSTVASAYLHGPGSQPRQEPPSKHSSRGSSRSRHRLACAVQVTSDGRSALAAIEGGAGEDCGGQRRAVGGEIDGGKRGVTGERKGAGPAPGWGRSPPGQCAGYGGPRPGAWPPPGRAGRRPAEAPAAPVR